MKITNSRFSCPVTKAVAQLKSIFSLKILGKYSCYQFMDNALFFSFLLMKDYSYFSYNEKIIWFKLFHFSVNKQEVYMMKEIWKFSWLLSEIPGISNFAVWIIYFANFFKVKGFLNIYLSTDVFVIVTQTCLSHSFVYAKCLMLYLMAADVFFLC